MESKLKKVEGNIYSWGCYGFRLSSSKPCEDYLYVGSGQMNDCLSRHLYFLKRGLYYDTNKCILQKYYDMGELVFEVIKESESNAVVNAYSPAQKEALQEALSVLEEFYIHMYGKTCCNVQKKVKKHSSNKDESSTVKRRYANIGSRNPRSIYNEKIICEILWINKNTDMKPREIIKHYKGLIKQGYISRIGLDRFIYLEPIKPDWYKGEKVVPTAIDTTSMNTLQSVPM